MCEKTEKQHELDKRYLRMAAIWAENSYCKRRQVGALLVKDKMIISDGYNGTPAGFENVCEDENNVTKPYVLHAEANAITKVAASSNSSKGATIYVTSSPCIECAKLIIQSGIKRVVYSENYRIADGCELMQRTGSNPDDIDLVIVATSTPDYQFPSIASILCDKLGLKNAFAFDMSAACCGFLYMMETAANFIRSGRYKKVIIVGADKMSSIVNYTDRATCPIFGDGAAAFMMEPTTEELGVMDAMLRTDGKGLPFLHLKAGGSVCPPSYFTIDNHMHYLYQEGRTVFKYAVSNMSDISAAIAEKNNLTKDTIDWVVPHQANLRIIDAVAHRLEVPHEKVLINIDRYGNTSAGTLPLCIWDFEEKLKKGDNLIFTAFGAGFTWGAVYVKWGYDGKKQ